MKKLKIFMLFIFIAFVSDAQKSVLPEGTEIKGGAVIVKDGYSFQLGSSNEVSVISRRTSVTTGTFKCGCSGAAEKKGDCAIKTINNSIQCESQGCSACGMETTINPPRSGTQKTKSKTNDVRIWVPVQF